MFPSRSRLLRRAPVPAAAVALLLSTASAQSSLVRNEREPMPRGFGAAAYDVARRCTVVFGGDVTEQQLLNDTAEWDGRRWLLRTPPQSPPASRFHSMVYDVARGRTVAFGGNLTDVWEWDGVTWHLCPSVVTPPPMSDPAMAYDPVRRRTVLYDGAYTGGSRQPSTWEWDGTAWTQRAPVNSPGVVWARLAYDVARQRTLLACRGAASSWLFELWAWDGSDWARLSASSLPSRPNVDRGFDLVYDVARQRLVLFGGEGSCADCDETWEWDGVTWSRRLSTVRPAGRNLRTMAYDVARQRTVLFGGTLGGQVSYSDTWEWDGSVWSPTTPERRSLVAMTYDAARERVVLFGGIGGSRRHLGDTWEWDGFRWRLATPTLSPSPRTNHVMAFDERRNRVVLFGGSGDNVPAFETWEWDGTNWARATPAVSPRAGGVMAYDRALQRVLFVGQNGSPAVVETWAWDGTTWTPVPSANRPSGGELRGLAYDAARQRAVLASAAGTWEWDGTDWSQAGASAAVSSLTYDPVRRLVLGAGSAALGTGSTLFEWRGGYWVRVTSGYSVDAMVFDAARGRLVSMTGRGIAVSGTPAAAADFGTGCGGTNGPPLLGSPEAFVGNESFAFDVANAPPLAPCVLGIAANSASATLPGNCTFYLSQPLLLPTVTSGVGAARIAVPIPATLGLSGAQLFAQAFVADTGGALQIAFSAGRRMTIGD